MDTRQLRHFVALAETLNYHRAAERLHMAQPPLSASIRKLEEQLGVQLFARTRRGTELTAAGTAALENARRALFHTEQFGRTAAAAANGEAGALRIGFVGSATYALMPQSMPLFRQRYPQVQLVLHESTTSRIMALLDKGDIDLGLLRFPLAQAGAIRVVPIERDVFVAALPQHSPLVQRRRLQLSHLAQEPFVLYSATEVPGLHATALLACQQAGFLPRVQQEAVQVQTVVSLVESGMGVALVPSVAARHTARNVVFKQLHGNGSAVEIGIALAYRPQAETPAARRFRETLEIMAGTGA
ncbi:LysR family transcriptional regulator [Ramlibacter sp. H39-3-26]|uniref:LysR family transcriptional regulator n=1 Tax=Curvibacter soli TaxID=3031331 RepID=UPI0023DA967F|nr:LysR family transcriptional regulator [Ramlibacter sp. H39-3-26]MDF1486102.1 LysR family transcriptional regulator [Ramlibacter sp. H39-3-26]